MNSQKIRNIKNQVNTVNYSTIKTKRMLRDNKINHTEALMNILSYQSDILYLFSKFIDELEDNPIPPSVVTIPGNGKVFYDCGSCYEEIDRNTSRCDECGKKVDWSGIIE